MNWGMLFTGLGYLTGFAVLAWQAKRQKLLTSGVAFVGAAGFFGGMVGARLTEFLTSGWPIRVPFSSIFNLETGGKALFGGLICGWIAAELAKKNIGLKRSLGDLFALAIPAGEAVGRIGCYFNGCCYGTVTTGPFAVYQHGAWRHPAQIYSAIVALAIFVVLYRVRDRLPHPGDLFRLYLVSFGVSRFLLEMVRERPNLIGPLSAMQVACIDLALFGAIALIISYRKSTVELAKG